MTRSDHFIGIFPTYFNNHLLQALRAQTDPQLWMSNNRLLENAGLGLTRGPGPGHSDSPGNIGNMNEWGGGGPLSLNLQPIYSPMAGQ